ncbi:ArsR family transcriptional regulator [Brevibacterium sanguinis]|uniref:ArsR family transcriptional regulator n=3 Tax=Brevibacteriaceae TaxID=85019 RepID=A0A366IP68_9MICO|nr:ArsR family transcriptional regulator [Brevibacterium sanguinis]RBP73570.1 ArsR family transcriptional regulator [Brevibacterium celere]
MRSASARHPEPIRREPRFRYSLPMASTEDPAPVSADVEALLRNPEGNLEAISETADLFKALATPSRLKMLLVLAHGEATVTHIVESTGLSQPLVSQHLKFLRGLHLVGVNRIGREAYYSLKDDHVAHIILDALAHTVELHEH